MENKYKMGDTLIGNEQASKIYGVTKEGWKGKVVHISKRGELTLEGGGNTFSQLNSSHFDLFEAAAPIESSDYIIF